MNFQHKQLAEGRWSEMALCEQIANIGSEVERAMKWRSKNNDYCIRALERALELLDLTIADSKNHSGARLKELARVREVLVDYFYFGNQYGSNDQLWHNYFYAFAYAARSRQKPGINIANNAADR
jgi:hypothetical protein